jgi:hypothetical protein
MGFMGTPRSCASRFIGPAGATRVRLGILGAILLLAGGGCRSAPTPPAHFEGTWSAPALLERSIEAYGGPGVLMDFTDMTVEHEIQARLGKTWRKGSALLRMKPPDLLYSAVRLKGGDEKVVFFDGSERGERINGEPTDRDVSPDLLQRRRSSMIHAFFRADDYAGVTLSSRDDLLGVACAVLSKEAGDETWRIWIDLEEFLIRKIRLVLPSAEASTGLPGRLTVEWYHADFKRVSGRLVPHAYRTYLNGELFQQGRVKAFALNQGLETGDFHP